MNHFTPVAPEHWAALLAHLSPQEAMALGKLQVSLAAQDTGAVQRFKRLVVSIPISEDDAVSARDARVMFLKQMAEMVIADGSNPAAAVNMLKVHGLIDGTPSERLVQHLFSGDAAANERLEGIFAAINKWMDDTYGKPKESTGFIKWLKRYFF